MPNNSTPPRRSRTRSTPSTPRRRARSETPNRNLNLHPQQLRILFNDHQQPDSPVGSVYSLNPRVRREVFFNLHNNNNNNNNANTVILTPVRSLKRRRNRNNNNNNNNNHTRRRIVYGAAK